MRLKNWIDCIESVVWPRRRVFVGTRLSAFSGYIDRLTGYMSDVGQKLVFDIKSTYPYDYYNFPQGPSWSLYRHGSYGGGHPNWAKEYKEAWEGAYESI